MFNRSLAALIAASGLMAAASVIGAARPAQAQQNWYQTYQPSVSERVYDFVRPYLSPVPAPAVYPDPLTGQPRSWSPSPNQRFGWPVMGPRG